MKDSTRRIISVAVGITIANYLYQGLSGGLHWEVAAERSYFQVAALGCLWLSGWISDQLRKKNK